MTALLLGAWLMMFLVMPSPRQSRDVFYSTEVGQLDCQESTVDGRRSALESPYSLRAELDLPSSDTIVHCRSRILPRDLREPSFDQLYANTESLSLQIAERLKQRNWQNHSWEVYVMSSPDATNAKIRHALKAQLAALGFRIKAAEAAWGSSTEIRPDQLSKSCPEAIKRPLGGRILILRPALASQVLRSALCTQEGVEWL